MVIDTDQQLLAIRKERRDAAERQIALMQTAVIQLEKLYDKTDIDPVSGQPLLSASVIEIRDPASGQVAGNVLAFDAFGGAYRIYLQVQFHSGPFIITGGRTGDSDNDKAHRAFATGFWKGSAPLALQVGHDGEIVLLSKGLNDRRNLLPISAVFAAFVQSVFNSEQRASAQYSSNSQ